MKSNGKILRTLSLTLCAVMLVSLLGACVSGSPASGSTSAGTAATTTAAKSTTTAAAAATTTTTPAPGEKRVTVTMVGTDVGITVPTNANPSDNAFVEIIEAYANVDFVYDLIPWMDQETKTNLLLASGTYPDIVYTSGNQNVYDVEDRGGFIDLLPYYQNSELVQKYIDYDEFMVKMKNAKTGGYYAIPMGMKGEGYPPGFWLKVRYDLVQKYNDGQWPKNMEGYIELGRKIKEGNPNAIPFSAWNPDTMIFEYQKMFWYMYGVESNMQILKQDDNSFIFNVQLPEYKAAMELHKQLYDEGLLSQTFATNTDYAMLINDWNNNDTFIRQDSVQQMAVPSTPIIETDQGKIWLCAPLLEEFPIPYDDAMKLNYQFDQFSTGERVHISSSSPHPDRAWRVIEALCCDELFDKIFWGDEGVTYKNVNGQRVIDESTLEAYNDPNRTWGRVYAMIMGFGHTRGANIAIARMQSDEPTQALIDMHMENCAQVGAAAQPIIAYNYNDLLSDDVAAKQNEAQGEMTSLVVQYIMGRVTMEQFDAAVAKFLETYGFMLEEHTAAYRERYLK